MQQITAIIQPHMTQKATDALEALLGYTLLEGRGRGLGGQPCSSAF